MLLPPTADRRKNSRSRVIYGGTIVQNQGRSRLDCVVQNYSDAGAKIVSDDIALLPDLIDLIIHRKGGPRRAKIVWRDEGEAGLSFLPPADTGAAVSIDWARRLRECETDRAALQARLEQLIADRG